MAKEQRYLLSTAAGLSDELIEIGGREFKAHPLTLKEANEIENADLLEDTLNSLATPLSRRSVDGEPVTGEFLLEHITKPFLTQLLQVLVNGRIEPNPKP